MTIRLTSSALALAAMTGPALADVTPEQVLQSWVDYYQSMGYSVTEGARSRDGATLTVTDVVFTAGTPESRVAMAVPQIALTDQGDGTVKTVFADQMQVTISGTEGDSGPYEVPATVALPGNSMITSGAPQDMTHTSDYPTIRFETTTLKSGGTETPLPVTVTVADSKGRFHATAGAPTKYDYDLTTGAVTYKADVTGENGDQVNLSGKLDGLQTAGTIAGAGAGADLENQMSAALDAGFALDGTLKGGPISGDFAFAGKDEAGQPTSGSGKYQGRGFDLGFVLSRDGMGYQAASDGVSVEVVSPQMPMPVRYAFDNASFDMQLPVSKADAPQPFKLAYGLAGLTIGDEMWAMFDPQSKLPRTPASLDIDVTGLMKVTENLFDAAKAADDAAPADDTDGATAEGVDPSAPADDAEADADAEAAAQAPSPLEPVELTINQVALDLLGAKVNASGVLKAPANGDMAAPVGSVHAEYQGISTLIDTLGEMGLIPQDKIMTVRMMLAMFAKPVEGQPDHMTTDLEFRDGGTIFANGQQIK